METVIMEFLDRLRRNAFSELSIDGFTVDTQGWMDDPFKNVIQRILSTRTLTDPLLIVEVGTWKGLSAITFANTLKSNGFTNFRILCIDTWLGAPEFWTWGIDDPTRGGSLNLAHGYPTVFSTFTKNVKALGHDDVIVPFPISSGQAADVLKFYKLSADIIYIDAAHEYEAVKRDIRDYYPLIKPGGWIVGDDYNNDVKRVVDEVISQPTIEYPFWFTMVTK